MSKTEHGPPIFSALDRTVLTRFAQNPRARRVLSMGVLLFTVAFLLFLITQSADQLSEFRDWPSYLSFAGLGFLLYPVSLGIQALIWLMIVARLGQMSGGWRDLEIYAYTHLARRLPGAVWYLAGRAAMYRARGVPARVALASSGLEWFLLLFASAVVYLAFAVTRDAMTPGLGLTIALLMLFSTGLDWVTKMSLRLRWTGFMGKRLRSLSNTRMPRRFDLVSWLALYALCYVIGGGILYLLVQGVSPGSIMLGAAVRVWALTGGVGFLFSAVIPASLGVRELTLTALLSPYIPTAAAILVAVFLRLLFISGDLVWGVALWIVARLVQRRVNTVVDGGKSIENANTSAENLPVYPK